MAQPVEVAPSVAKGGAAGSSSAARSCASRALPLGPSTLEAEPSRAAGGSAEHADEQRGGEARAIRTPLAPAQLQAEPRRPRVLLGVSGSVAAIKAAEVAALLCAWADVRMVTTEVGRRFVTGQLPPGVALYGDAAEWRQWQRVGDEVLHIELRRWADALVLAPLSANTLAKAAHGLCDNLLTCVVRAWDWGKPLLLAPAMNTYMWDSPFTTQQLAVLSGLGAQIVPPVSKALACGDVGLGAMAAPQTINDAAREAMRQLFIRGEGAGA